MQLSQKYLKIIIKCNTIKLINTLLMMPVFREGFDWLTSGTFGLEASPLGLICVVAALILLYGWKVK